jgi:hypothetical protein
MERQGGGGCQTYIEWVDEGKKARPLWDRDASGILMLVQLCTMRAKADTSRVVCEYIIVTLRAANRAVRTCKIDFLRWLAKPERSRPSEVRESMRFSYDRAVKLELVFKVLDHKYDGDTVDRDPWPYALVRDLNPDFGRS